MGFIDSIKECFSPDEIPCETVYRAVVFGDRAIYLENICSLESYAEDLVCLRLKRGALKIKGQKLYVKKYCLGDVIICGQITGIERV